MCVRVCVCVCVYVCVLPPLAIRESPLLSGRVGSAVLVQIRDADWLHWVSSVGEGAASGGFGASGSSPLQSPLAFGGGEGVAPPVTAER